MNNLFEDSKKFRKIKDILLTSRIVGVEEDIDGVCLTLDNGLYVFFAAEREVYFDDEECHFSFGISCGHEKAIVISKAKSSLIGGVKDALRIRCVACGLQGFVFDFTAQADEAASHEGAIDLKPFKKIVWHRQREVWS